MQRCTMKLLTLYYDHNDRTGRFSRAYMYLNDTLTCETLHCKHVRIPLTLIIIVDHNITSIFLKGFPTM